MALVAGIRAFVQTPTPNNPHILGHVVPRVANDPLFVVANDGTGTDRRLIVHPNRVEVAGDLSVGGNIIGYARSPHGNEAHTENYLSEAVVDGLATEAQLNAHAALTAAHGATGQVVGTTNTQTLTNKTLTSPTISSPTINTSVQGTAFATEEEARTGTSVTKLMNPARTNEAVRERIHLATGGFELLEDRVLSTPSGSATFNVNTSLFMEWKIEFYGRTTGNNISPILRFNNNTTNYDWSATRLRSSVSGLVNDASTSSGSIPIVSAHGPLQSGNPISATIEVIDQSNTVPKIAHVTSLIREPGGASPSLLGLRTEVMGRWSVSTNLMTIGIQLAGGTLWVAGSRFMLYGRRRV